LRFCTVVDGTRIAIASIGAGPPLLRAAHWLSHVEHDLHSPVWRPWLAELARDHHYIRYDQRGCGLSDSAVADFSLDAWVGDLEAVVDSLGLRRFPLIGMSQGGAVAIAYAVRHPDKVSHLVLPGAYARGALQRATSDAERLEAETLVNLIRLGWGRDNAAFRQVFTNQFIPGGTPAQHQWSPVVERTGAPDGQPRERRAHARSVPPRRRDGPGAPAVCAHAGAARARRCACAVRRRAATGGADPGGALRATGK
jgi:pimeloyl-ACP methyl ester carboxylesterase